MADSEAETILKTHQRTNKQRFTFTMKDGTIYGTDNEDEVPALRKAILQRAKIIR